MKAGTVPAVDRVLAFLRLASDRGSWSYQDLQHWAAVLEVDGVLAPEAKSAIRKAAEDAALQNLPARDEDLAAWFIDPEAPEAGNVWEPFVVSRTLAPLL